MEETNQNQQPSNTYNNNDYEPRGTSPWRIVLSVVAAIFAVGRLAYTCSGAKQRQNQQQNTEFQQMMQESQSQYEESNRTGLAESERISNDMMYTDYDGLQALTADEQAIYKITKIEKDSVMRFDMSTEIKLEKGSYLQKNFDDSLKIAIKTPDNMTIFVHDFAGKGDLKFNFMEMKRKRSLKDFKTGDDVGKSTKTFSYSIEQNQKPFNGYAIASSGNAGYFWFMEFESDNIKKDVLKQKAMAYLTANLKVIK
jgi:hypothetical protein